MLRRQPHRHHAVMTMARGAPRDVSGVRAFVPGAQLEGQANARSHRTGQDQAGPGG